jgi:hypothetical protein
MLTHYNIPEDLNVKQQSCQNVRPRQATDYCCERLLLYHKTLDLRDEKKHITDTDLLQLLKY